MNLSGKVAVVTGAANGLGEAVARRFASEGAKLVLTDIEVSSLNQVAADIDGVALSADMSVEANVQAVAELAMKTHGRIDVWISNAGMNGPRQPGNLQDNELWDSMWRLHVMSHVYAARAVLPDMLARGDGYLLATSSSIALATAIEKVAYSVTKHGLVALCEWLAATYRPKGIKVSCMCPGAIRTRIFLTNNFPEDSFAMRSSLSPEQAAELVIRGIESEKFLLLTHPENADALAEKATDYDRWIESIAPTYPA